LKSLFALERTLISGANEQFKKKSDERTDKIQILSGSLMSDRRKKECSKNGSKTHENAQFVHILIKNGAKKRLIVVFSFLPPLFHKFCVLELPPPFPPPPPPGGISFTLYIHL
jgi:hypothetical protein